MDWDKLRIFHAVADAGSFTHAGHELGLSQSAVSRQISALEHELRVPLFHRHARGLILTEQGELLYRTAHDVFTRLASAQTRLMDSKDKPSGNLRLTTTVGLGTIWVTPRLNEFIELYPEINVELLLDDRELDLGMREADIAIRLRRPVQPDLIQRRLFTVHHHIYASPDYIRRHGMPRTLEDLDNHVVLAFGTAPSYLADVNWLEMAGREPGNPRRPALRINNVYGLRRAVESGIGIASLPDYIVGRDSNLVQLLREAEVPEFDTYLVYPEELKTSKRVAVFRDFVISKAKEWSF
ncbi:LysR family transcriptional regulator [Kaustia mangrovi]|uniref:LysR family transcriptional regulator n=1 Tax=Kaustia mangrovi TaxID=2593653 RepID=A0A7S8C5F8_9HYPH|nr:LysR family transcriptional regulator [Kaustia mangrovi]QPC43728.1 LysR family transcriptional regulator [Kaustia mangrovi]